MGEVFFGFDVFRFVLMFFMCACARAAGKHHFWVCDVASPHLRLEEDDSDDERSMASLALPGKVQAGGGLFSVAGPAWILLGCPRNLVHG